METETAKYRQMCYAMLRAEKEADVFVGGKKSLFKDFPELVVKKTGVPTEEQWKKLESFRGYYADVVEGMGPRR
ncbi:MAG: hypothetical protein LBL21_01035 [Rickettsiales bacterium]|jgi:hypothetical protein|nr:hypothetical protein [Rickettsiales bacterium]